MSADRPPRPIDGRTVALAVGAAILWVALVRPGPLDLPWFWDEADVYVPGARWLAEHGLDFRPGVFPDDWSRGHPPLLYLLAGIAFQWFGAVPTVGHLLVLPFGVMALASTWLLGDTLFGRPAGAAAALLLGLTPLFMSMTNMLLPEVPLTGLTALALLLFARGHLLGATLCGCALVLIKETGVFTPAAITGAVLLAEAKAGRLKQRETWRRLAIAAAPVAVLIGFFVWQKALAGYYVFPHHAGMLADGTIEVTRTLPSLLLVHGRGALVVCVVLALVLARRGSLDLAGPRPATEPTLALLLLLAANVVFFAKMFWLERYALPAHPGLLVLLAGTLIQIPRRGGWAVIAISAVSGVAGLWSTPGPNEAELTFAYADVIATHREAFAEVPDDAVVLTTWPMTEELRQPDLGFVDSAVQVVHARHLQDSAEPPRFTHALIAAASPQAEAMRSAAAARGLHQLASFQVGIAPQALELYGP